MRLQNIILGLVIMIVAMTIVITIALDAYSPNNYNINLSEDEDTQMLTTLQEKTNENYETIKGSYEDMRQRTPGQNQSTYNAQIGLTEGDLQQSALTAIKESHTFLDTFTDMINVMLNSIGLSVTTRGLLLWFFGLLIGIPIVFLLINSLLRNVI